MALQPYDVCMFDCDAVRARSEKETLSETITAWMENRGWHQVREWKSSFDVEFMRADGDAVVTITLIKDDGQYTGLTVKGYSQSFHYNMYDPQLFERMENRARWIWHYGAYPPSIPINWDKFCSQDCEENHLSCSLCDRYEQSCWLCWHDQSMKFPHDQCDEFVCRRIRELEEHKEACRGDKDDDPCENCDVDDDDDWGCNACEECDRECDTCRELD